MAAIIENSAATPILTDNLEYIHSIKKLHIKHIFHKYINIVFEMFEYN